MKRYTVTTTIKATVTAANKGIVLSSPKTNCHECGETITKQK
jgi:hypothetical protein